MITESPGPGLLIPFREGEEHSGVPLCDAAANGDLAETFRPHVYRPMSMNIRLGK